MIRAVDSLRVRYDAAFESDSDSLFYQNLHHYFDLIVKTPALSALLVGSQKEYAEKHGAIWGHERSKTDEEADDKSERTFRLERFNLYALAATIMVRIYVRIEDYKNSLHEPEIDQDPAAVLMIRGIKNINPKYAKVNPFKWGHDRLKVLNRWYEGKRPYYEKELRQFHLALLAAIEEADSGIQDFEFNGGTGAFKYRSMSGSFAINSQEYKVFNALYRAPQRTLAYFDLIRAIHPRAEVVSKTEKSYLYKVVSNIKRKLGIPKPNPDVFRNSRGGGYHLVFPAKNVGRIDGE